MLRRTIRKLVAPTASLFNHSPSTFLFNHPPTNTSTRLVHYAYSFPCTTTSYGGGYAIGEDYIEGDTEYEDVVKQPSLKKLLASPQRDYVISNKGDMVPIHTLEDKVVGLYLYKEGFSARYFTDSLKSAYQELAKIKENFEVVLVYLDDPETSDHTNERSFWRTFSTMPWLALPFGDPNNKKLSKIFEFVDSTEEPCQIPELVIFGPHGKFIEPFGASILGKYEIPAYPFTRKKVAELEAERVKEMKLEMLWEPNTTFSGKDGSQILLSELSGKRVIFYFQMSSTLDAAIDSQKIEFIKLLKERYLLMKGTDDEFVVIHIFETETESSGDIYISKIDIYAEMPWSVVQLPAEMFPANLISFFSCFFEKNVFLGKTVFLGYEFSAILAFDRDGRLVRRTIYPTVEDMNFPFYPGGLEEETLVQLNSFFEWYYWKYFPNKGRIYSYGGRDTITKIYET